MEVKIPPTDLESPYSSEKESLRVLKTREAKSRVGGGGEAQSLLLAVMFY